LKLGARKKLLAAFEQQKSQPAAVNIEEKKNSMPSDIYLQDIEIKECIGSGSFG
jgi:hypothetical protein